jgi:hypothetical protein
LRFAPRVTGSLCRLLHPAALRLVVMRPREFLGKVVQPGAEVFVDIRNIRRMFSMEMPHLGAPSQRQATAEGRW